MADTTYNAPFIVDNTTTGNIAASEAGNSNFDLDLYRTISVTAADILHGSVNYRQRMLISFSGTTQEYIGVVTENPKRQFLGGFALSNDGFVVNESNRKFQYINESIVISEGVIPIVMPSEQSVGALSSISPAPIRLNVGRDSFIKYDRNDFVPIFDVGVTPGGAASGGQFVNTVGMYSSGAGGEGRFSARQSLGGSSAGLLGNVQTYFYPIEGRVEAGGLPIIGDIGTIKLFPFDSQVDSGTLVGDLELITAPKSINIWLRQGVGATFSVYTERLGLYQDSSAKTSNPDVILGTQTFSLSSPRFAEVAVPNE
jgi:hypothetical protein